MADVGQIFASDRGTLDFNALAGTIRKKTFTSPETRMIVLSESKTA